MNRGPILAASGAPLARVSMHSSLPGRAEIENGAASAGRVFEETAALAMDHHDFVVVVNRLRIPIPRQQCGKRHMGRPDIHRLRNEPGALGDAVMVAVDGKV